MKRGFQSLYVLGENRYNEEDKHYVQNEKENDDGRIKHTSSCGDYRHGSITDYFITEDNHS